MSNRPSENKYSKVENLNTFNDQHQKIYDFLKVPFESVRVLCLFDIHLPDTDFHVFQLMLNIIEDMDIDLILLGGDNLDLGGLSSFSPDTRPSGYKLFESDLNIGVNAINILINCIQDAIKNYDLPPIILEGNHEYRIIRSALENSRSSAIRNYLDYLESMRTIGTAYYNKHNLEYGLWFRFNENTIVGHGDAAFPRMKNKILRDYGHVNAVFGHLHYFDSHTHSTHTGLSEVHCIGTMGNLSPHYEKFGSHKAYQNGFAVVEYDPIGNYSIINPIKMYHKDKEIIAKSGIFELGRINKEDDGVLCEPLQDLKKFINIEEQYSKLFEKPQQQGKASKVTAPEGNRFIVLSDDRAHAYASLLEAKEKALEYHFPSQYAIFYQDSDKVFVVRERLFDIIDSGYTILEHLTAKYLPRVYDGGANVRRNFFDNKIPLLNDDEYIVIWADNKGLRHYWKISI